MIAGLRAHNWRETTKKKNLNKFSIFMCWTEKWTNPVQFRNGERVIPYILATIAASFQHAICSLILVAFSGLMCLLCTSNLSLSLSLSHKHNLTHRHGVITSLDVLLLWCAVFSISPFFLCIYSIFCFIHFRIILQWLVTSHASERWNERERKSEKIYALNSCLGAAIYFLNSCS